MNIWNSASGMWIRRSLKFVTEGVTDLSCIKMCCWDLKRCRSYFVDTHRTIIVLEEQKQISSNFTSIANKLLELSEWYHFDGSYSSYYHFYFSSDGFALKGKFHENMFFVSPVTVVVWVAPFLQNRLLYSTVKYSDMAERGTLGRNNVTGVLLDPK